MPSRDGVDPTTPVSGADAGGEANLDKLLSSMAPELDPEEFVFVSFEGARYGDHADLNPVAAVAEQEGLTLVVPKTIAEEHGIACGAVFKRITLNVHSSLEAVGLTAAVAGKLAALGLSANVVAGYYHDHIFLPCAQAEPALVALRELASASKSGPNAVGCAHDSGA